MNSSSNFINTNKLFRAVVIAGLGTLASLWTNCIFVICLQKNFDNTYDGPVYNIKSYNLIFQTIQYEYVGICLLASVTLIWGLTKLYWKYLLLWSCLKFCENIAISVGTFLIVCKYSKSRNFYGLIPLGIAAICINVYVLLYVYKAYKRMAVPLLMKNLKNSDCESLIIEETNGEDSTIKIEELKPLATETSIDNIPSKKCEEI